MKSEVTRLSYILAGMPPIIDTIMAAIESGRTITYRPLVRLIAAYARPTDRALMPCFLLSIDQQLSFTANDREYCLHMYLTGDRELMCCLDQQNGAFHWPMSRWLTLESSAEAEVEWNIRSLCGYLERSSFFHPSQSTMADYFTSEIMHLFNAYVGEEDERYPQKMKRAHEYTMAPAKCPPSLMPAHATLNMLLSLPR
jgi:hypothetical protein